MFAAQFISRTDAPGKDTTSNTRSWLRICCVSGPNMRHTYHCRRGKILFTFEHSQTRVLYCQTWSPAIAFSLQISFGRISNAEKTTIGVQTCYQRRRRKCVHRPHQPSRRRVHVELLSCLRRRVPLKRTLKLRIMAEALDLLAKLPEQALQHKDLKIIAAALLSFGFAFHCTRDNTNHKRAEHLCRQQLGLDLKKCSASQGQFAEAKAMLINLRM